MATEYRIDVKSIEGAKVAVITDYLTLSYTRRVNAPGLLTFTLPEEHVAIDEFELDGQIEVWRRNTSQSLDWYADFYAFWRTYQWADDDQGKTRYKVTAPGQMHLLSRRIVNYKAGTANRSAFTGVAGETLMRTLVAYNATTAATVLDGRERAGALTGVSVAADGGGGNTLDRNCAWRPLLAELQTLADVAGGDFDLVKTGARAWEWRFYEGQLGTDRSTTVQFSKLLGNMRRPMLDYDAIDEKTVAVVAGQGTEADRAVVVRTGPNYSADNDIEVFVDARTTETEAGLQAVGDRRLEELRAKTVLRFETLQTPARFYGQHYFLGDLVEATYKGVTETYKIQEVTVTVNSDGTEAVKLGLKNV